MSEKTQRVFALAWMLLLVVWIIVLTYIFVARGEAYKKERLHNEMIVAYYEAKLDWYEMEYNIDLDDTPNGFIEYLAVNYPEVYIYFKEREE
jgi:hypothetical protein